MKTNTLEPYPGFDPTIHAGNRIPTEQLFNIGDYVETLLTAGRSVEEVIKRTVGAIVANGPVVEESSDPKIHGVYHPAEILESMDYSGDDKEQLTAEMIEVAGLKKAVNILAGYPEFFEILHQDGGIFGLAYRSYSETVALKMEDPLVLEGYHDAEDYLGNAEHDSSSAQHSIGSKAIQTAGIRQPIDSDAWEQIAAHHAKQGTSHDSRGVA